MDWTDLEYKKEKAALNQVVQLKSSNSVSYGSNLHLYFKCPEH
jgi:hypothetical protein